MMKATSVTYFTYVVRLLVVLVLVVVDAHSLELNFSNRGSGNSSRRTTGNVRQEVNPIFDPDKFTPDKGDAECRPIRDRFIAFLNGDQERWFRSCNKNGGYGKDNKITIHIYVAVKPFRPSLGAVVTAIMTNVLDTVTDDNDYNISLLNLERDGSGRHSKRFLQQESQDGENDSITTGAEHGKGEDYPAVNLFHAHTSSTNIARERLLWWWKYDITYTSFEERSGDAIYDSKWLETIESDLETEIKTHYHRIREAFAGQELPTFVDLAIDDPTQPIEEDGITPIPTLGPTALDDDDDRFGSTNETESFPTAAPDKGHGLGGRDDWNTSKTNSTSEIMAHLDAHEWDWRRYLGLGLFLATSIGTFLLTQVASCRQRRRNQRELWGNLATEEGLDELLKTGWKVDGERMEIYDKTKMGYKEGDSMLMGGFQQTEVLNTEITVTQSETTPESSHQFFQPWSSSGSADR